jgi:hypothetical protein
MDARVNIMRIRQEPVRNSLFATVLWAALAAQAAPPVVSNIGMVPRLTIQSDPGATVQIQYCTDLLQSNWMALSNVVVAQSPYWFIDVSAPAAPQRFYRAVAGPTNTPPPSGWALIPAGTFTMGEPMTATPTMMRPRTLST